MKKLALHFCRVQALHCLKLRKLFQLLLLTLCISFTAYAGNNGPEDSSMVSMKLTNAPIEKAFALIKQQTDFRVLYDNKLVKSANPVNVEVRNVSLAKLLPILFTNQPFGYRVMDYSVIVTPTLNASLTTLSSPLFADTIITGMVMADSGFLPLVGANIQLKGTNKMTTTDNNGHFKIAIPEAGGILQISYIGHTTKSLTVTKQSSFPLTVFLQKQPTDMEVITLVSTGYEAVPRERITGSFTQIDNKQLNEQAGGNIIERLRGVASSVLFDRKNDGPSFSIRGLSTINGPKEPLIILDNYPYEGDINNININDVENITILKDAAAASIWGTRAGNGVVVITTKKGKYNQPFKLEFNSNIVITEKPNLYYLPQMTSSDFIDVEEMLFDKGFYNGQIASPLKVLLTPAIEILLKKRNGTITEDVATTQLNKLKLIDARDGYNKYFYRNAVNQQYALNLRAGSDKISYFLSAGYDKGISNLDAINNRITLRSENTYKPVKSLQVNFGLMYINSSAESGKPGYDGVLAGAKNIPYLSFVDNDGNPIPMGKNYRKSFTDTAGAGKLLDWNYYPLEDYKYNTSKNNRSDLVGKLGLNYLIMPGLNIDIKYQYQIQQTTTTTLAGVQSYYARDLINKYSVIDYNTGKVSYGFPVGGILNKSLSKIETQNIRAQINFNKKMGQHELVSLIGSEVRESKINTDNLSALGYDPDLLTQGIIDATNPHQNFVTKAYDYLNAAGVNFLSKNNRFVSFFGNASYIFKGKYIFSGSLRKDASNLFGKATNEKWTPLWSIGGGWNISNEKFYHSSILPELKLRATYGYSGNVDQSKSAVTVMRYTGNASYTNLQSAGITQFKNSELRWEKVRMFNLGIDFCFKNKLVSGSLEYYRKMGIDLFGPSPIDYTAGLGYYSIIKNVANMKGRGWDLTLVIQTVKNKKIDWTTSFNFSNNVAKTEKYYLGKGLSSGSFVNYGSSITPIPGRSLYSIISYKSNKLNSQGHPQGYINNQLSIDYNAISNDTSLSNLVFQGSASPKYFGSIINNFKWNGVTVSVNLSYKLGYYFRRAYNSYDQLFNNRIGHNEYANRWQKSGDEFITNVPSLIYPNNWERDLFYGLSEATIEKGDHIRLQYLSISYSLKRITQEKSFFNKVQVYSNFTNLGVLWKSNRKGIDPDVSNGIPAPKVYTIGIRTII